jgi:hypothetical protein
MRSPGSLGVVFIAMGGLSLSGIGGRHPLGPVAWAIAALLVLAGVAMLTRRAFAFYVALAAALVTATTGVLPYLGHPELALPVPPALSIGVGLYLILRTAIARAALGRRTRGFLPKDDPAA